MNRDEALEVVRTAIANQFSVDPALIDVETTAADVGGWDSFSNGVLIMTIEDMIARSLPFEEMAMAANVGEMADIVAQPRV